MTPTETAGALQAHFGQAIQDIATFRGEVTAVVDRSALPEVARYCHDELGYDFLSDVSAVDWLDRDPRFDR